MGHELDVYIRAQSAGALCLPQQLVVIAIAALIDKFQNVGPAVGAVTVLG